MKPLTVRIIGQVGLTLSTLGLASAAQLPKAGLAFLRDMTKDVIAASSVPPGSNGGGRCPLTNACGFTLITPGKDTYTAFWIRDFSMAAESGLIPAPALLDHLLLVCRTQNGATERKLAHGLHLPPWSIPDHINYDGRASFFPGTYSSGEDQGDGTFGRMPPIDDHYEFIHIAYLYWQQSHDREALTRRVNGISVFERLRLAFGSPNSDVRTGLVETSEEDRAVGFGFCDAEIHTGKLLFASLLRYRAAHELAELAAQAGHQELIPELRRIQELIAINVPIAFRDSSAPGWLRACTGISRQADVWGTLFALHLKVLGQADGLAARRTVAAAVRAGTITFEGGVRHVPTDLDFSASTAWERSLSPRNTYQNGGYWHTPSGWLIESLWSEDEVLSRQLFAETIAHLRTHDYRKGPAFGAPWEVFGRAGQARQNPVYMASVALPYGVLKQLPQ